MPFGLFRRKKEEEKKEGKKSEKSLLEELCGDNKDLYRVLSRSVLLNPSQLEKEGIESIVNKGGEYEKSNDYLRARIQYQAAGQLALYLGKLDLIPSLYDKCLKAELQKPNQNPEVKYICEFFLKKENVVRALPIIKEFYAKTIKVIPEKAPAVADETSTQGGAGTG